MDPFEIAHRHTPRIRNDVRHHQNAALLQHIVGLGRGGAVGPFDDHARLNMLGVLGRDLLLQRSGHHDVAGYLPKSLRGQGFTLLKSTHAALFFHMLQQSIHIKARRLVKTCFVILHGHQLGTCLCKQLRGHAAHVAQTLNGDGGIAKTHADFGCSFARHRDHTATRGFASTKRPAQLNGLACDHA